MTIKIFVWEGPEVLKNYGPGIVVAAAHTEDEAWAKLKASDFRAFTWLQTGVKDAYSEEDLEWRDASDMPEGWVIIHPTGYDPRNMPTLVIFGGE